MPRPRRLILLAAVSLGAALAAPLIVGTACALRAPVKRPSASFTSRAPGAADWELHEPTCGMEPDPVDHLEARLTRLESALDPAWLRAFESSPANRYKRIDSMDGPGLTVESLSCFVPDQSARARVDAVRAGWPFACLTGRSVSIEGGPETTAGLIEAPIRLCPGDDPFLLTRRLPLQPLWPGLLADSGLFTAAVLAFMWVAALVRALHGRLRHDPDRCRSCNYSLVGLPPGAPCPECGAPTPTPPKTCPRGPGRPIVP